MRRLPTCSGADDWFPGDGGHSQGIALSVDLIGATGADGLVGYRAKRHTGVVDVDAPGSCAVADYWEPIRADGSKRLILDPDQFYILASKEAVHVPPTHAAEMMPFNPLVGEFRVHYAGFMDPGFGHAPAGGAGSTPCWKCARTRCRSFSKTARSSAGWSTSA